jgi:hypothetical protein
MRRLEHGVEFLDRPIAAADRDASLADVDRLNAWFGGYRLTLRALDRLLHGTDPARRLVVVDIGGGRGDFARRIVGWGRRRGRAVRVIVVDRVVGRPRPGVLCVVGDATALPLREGSVDAATASLTLHHLEPDAAVRALAEMAAVARVGIVVNDLLRTRLSLALVWLATRVLCRHRFPRHDGPLSVRRAYAGDELRALAEKAGIPALVVRGYPLLARLVAVARS